MEIIFNLKMGYLFMTEPQKCYNGFKLFNPEEMN